MDLTSLVAQANSYMETAHEQISSAMANRFGGAVLDIEQSSVYDQVCSLRFLKKFQKPTKSGIHERKRKCIDKWLATEQDGANIKFDSLPLSVKGHLYRARQLLSEWLKDFKLGNEVEFTPGESFESSRGNTSVYHKLAYRSHWTCTHDAFDDFALFVYSNVGLKRSARRLMKPLTQTESIRLLAEHESAFGVFKHRLESIVTFTHGSRLSTVEKNNEIDRAINVETTANMLMQRRVAQPIRAILASIGNDLEVGQAVHRARIRHKTQATIDFSEASDRVWMDIIRNMYPSNVLRYLRRYRSEMVLVDDTYYWVNKLSSMGCGFTFEIMTMLLLAVARVLDSNATVYGDDVIIESSHAPRFIEICNAIGMKVNVAKSFVDSPLRESCGAYYHDDYGYITGFDFRWCENWNDVTIACNKLRVIIEHHPDKLNSFLCHVLVDLRRKLLSLAPAFARGPACNDIGCGYIHDDQWKRAQKKCSVTRRMYNDVKRVTNEFMQQWEQSNGYAVCKVQTFRKPDSFARHTRNYVNAGPRYLASLLAGQYAPAVTGIEAIPTWHLVIVHPDLPGAVRFKALRDLKETQIRHSELAERRANGVAAH